MENQSTRAWIESRRDLWLDLLRIYLGAALLIKGMVFVGNAAALSETMTASRIPFGDVGLLHYVVTAHLAGGIMLLFGIATRAADAANIPVLLGAVLFVHRREGLFAQGQSLELTLLVLFLLVLFTINGSGRLSVDHYRRASGYEPPMEPHPA